jgi:Helix-turn-helix
MREKSGAIEATGSRTPELQRPLSLKPAFRTDVKFMIAEIRLRLNAPYHVHFMEPSGPRLRANRRKQEILLSMLREAREQKGLRQSDVATALECPQTRVSKYELGTRRLDLLELRDVCQVLGVSLVEFVRTFDASVGAVEAGGSKLPRATRTRPKA